MHTVVIVDHMMHAQLHIAALLCNCVMQFDRFTYVVLMDLKCCSSAGGVFRYIRSHFPTTKLNKDLLSFDSNMQHCQFLLKKVCILTVI